MTTPRRRSWPGASIVTSGAVILAALLAGFGCMPDRPTERAKITLVGIDGATWDVIDPMLAAGELPTIARLIEEGVRARLRSQKPLVSPAVWTTITVIAP